MSTTQGNPQDLEEYDPFVVPAPAPTVPIETPATPATPVKKVKLGVVPKIVPMVRSKGFIGVMGNTVTMKKISWLWGKRVPLGKLTLFVGNPDNGKSLVACDVAAKVTTGEKFFDAVNLNPPADVLWLAGEEDIDDTTIPRLHAAGADVSKIKFLQQTETNTGVREIRLDTDIKHLEAEIIQQPNIRLIVVDPISNYLGDARMNVEQEIRSKILTPLKLLAEKHNIAVVAIMHLNKKEDLDAINRIGGAMAFTGVARAVWLFASATIADEDSATDEGLMLRVKNNNQPKSLRGLRFRIKGVSVSIANSQESMPVVEWLGETLHSAEIITRQASGADSKLQQAVEWLRSFLGDVEHLAQDVQVAAKKAGFRPATLRRAREHLAIEPERRNDKWYWFL